MTAPPDQISTNDPEWCAGCRQKHSKCECPVTAVDRPDNGQDEGREPDASDRGRAVAEGLLARLYEGMSDDDMLAYVAGALAAERAYVLASGRAGAGEQQREQVEAVIESQLWQREQFTLDIPDEPGHRLAWAAGAGPFIRGLAAELLALLGGPQPDGEADRG